MEFTVRVKEIGTILHTFPHSAKPPLPQAPLKVTTRPSTLRKSLFQLFERIFNILLICLTASSNLSPTLISGPENHNN